MTLQLVELSDAGFHATFSQKMKETRDLGFDDSLLDRYLELLALASPDLIDWSAIEMELSYVGTDKHFQHMLYPEGRKNVYLVIVADLISQRIHGHFVLDLNDKYGLPTPPRS